MDSQITYHFSKSSAQLEDTLICSNRVPRKCRSKREQPARPRKCTYDLHLSQTRTRGVVSSFGFLDGGCALEPFEALMVAGGSRVSDGDDWRGCREWTSEGSSRATAAGAKVGGRGALPRSLLPAPLFFVLSARAGHYGTAQNGRSPRPADAVFLSLSLSLCYPFLFHLHSHSRSHRGLPMS